MYRWLLIGSFLLQYVVNAAGLWTKSVLVNNKGDHTPFWNHSGDIKSLVKVVCLSHSNFILGCDPLSLLKKKVVPSGGPSLIWNHSFFKKNNTLVPLSLCTMISFWRGIPFITVAIHGHQNNIVVPQSCTWALWKTRVFTRDSYIIYGLKSCFHPKAKNNNNNNNNRDHSMTCRPTAASKNGINVNIFFLQKWDKNLFILRWEMGKFNTWLGTFILLLLGTRGTMYDKKDQ